ncbi:MAG TPA: hypothetical protein PLA54_11420 [Spirochaetota bacterium]|nr:hypothetical protein [Spirochaetota bacterium]
MRNILILLGILSIIGGIVLGFSDTMKTFKLTAECITAGIIQSVTYFALAYLVNKADKNEVQRKLDFDNLRKLLMLGLPKRKCPYCETEYELDRNVCPKCNR